MDNINTHRGKRYQATYACPTKAADHIALRSLCNFFVFCLKNMATFGRWPGRAYDSLFSMCQRAL